LPIASAAIGSAQSARRHLRIALEHDEHEAAHRNQVAGETLYDELQAVAHAIGGEGEPRHEFAGVAILEIADVLRQQPVEHAPLRVGDDAVADSRQHDLRAEGRRATQHEQPQRLEREPTHRPELVGLGHPVEHGPKQPSDADIGKRDQRQEHGGGDVAGDVVAAEVPQQPPKYRQARIILR